MSKWPMMPLGQVISADRRPLNPIAERSYAEVGVRSFGRGLFRKPSITGADLGTKRVFSIVPDRLIFNIVFAWEGAVARTTAAEGGTIASHRFPIFECDPDRADLDFMTYLFRSEFGLGLMRRASPGSAGRNRTLSLDKLQESLVPVPPLDEQRQIASWLAQIERQSSQLHTNQEFKARKIRAARLSLLEQATQSAPVRRLSEVVALVRRPVPVNLDAEYIQIGVRSFGHGLFIKPPVLGIQLGSKRIFSVVPGDLVVSLVFAWEGAVAIAENAHEGTVGSHRFLSFQVDSDLATVEYVAWWLSSPAGIEALGQASPGSAGRNRTLSTSRLLECSLPVPPMSTQIDLRRVYRTIERVSEISDTSSRHSKSLLPAALNQVFGPLN